MKESRLSGFSLIELLVSVAIISILVALLISGISTVRTRLDRTHCLANLHGLGVATALFMAENEGALPQVNWWETQILTYLNITTDIGYFISPSKVQAASRASSPLYCPATTSNDLRYGSMGGGNVWADRLSYGVNATLGGNGSSPSLTAPIRKLSYFSGLDSSFNASQLIVYLDAHSPNVYDNMPLAPAVFGPNTIPSRHAPGVNALFADFHVEFIITPVGSTEWRNLFWGYPRYH